MSIYNLYYKSFIDNNYFYIIGYLVITCILLLTETIVAPLYYSNIITSLNFNSNIFNKKFNNIFYILVFIWLFIFIMYKIKYYIDENIISKYGTYLRNKFLEMTFEKYKNNIKDIKIGNHITRIMTVSLKATNGLHYFLYLIFPSIFGLLIISLFLIKININLGLFLLFGLIIYIFFIILYSKKIINIISIKDIFFYKNIDKLNNKFENLINIYLNNQMNNEINETKNNQKYIKQLIQKEMDLINELTFSLKIITVIMFFGLVFISYYSFKKNKLLKYNFILILIILTYFLNISFKLISSFPVFLECISSIIGSYNYFNDFSKINNNNYKKILISSGSIKINNLSFYYPLDNNNHNKKYIFKNLNLEIKSGERLAILGSSGSGKSTLCKLLINLYNYQGSIYLDNYDIKKIDDEILRQNIIYVNQKTHLFDDTIFENIKYGNNNISNDDILKVINKYHFDYIYQGLKNNYNTNCGVNGNNLSMGMQKITILLRAYFKFNNSKVIIFDEPLASLDHNTRQNVLKLINDIDKNKTIIIITHDTEILSIVNRKIDITSDLQKNGV